MDTAAKLDAPLDDLIASPRGVRRGGRAPPSGGPPAGGGFRNHAGKSHMKGATLQEIAAAPEDERVLKVGAATTAKKLAGSISYVTREGAPPMLLPLGATCINQAVKGVAIARKYLVDDSVDLTCEPRFREFGRKSVSLHLTAVHYAPASSDSPANEVTLTVAASSTPATVGGAIANKVREKLPLCLKCVGAAAVANAVFAIANAREFLSKDGIAICCMPELVDEELSAGGETRTVVKFTICIASQEAGAEPVIKAAAAPRRRAAPREEAEAEPVRRGGRAAGGRPPRAAAAGEPVRRGGRAPSARGAAADGALKVTVTI